MLLRGLATPKSDIFSFLLFLHVFISISSAARVCQITNILFVNSLFGTLQPNLIPNFSFPCFHMPCQHFNMQQQFLQIFYFPNFIQTTVYVCVNIYSFSHWRKNPMKQSNKQRKNNSFTFPFTSFRKGLRICKPRGDYFATSGYA